MKITEILNPLHILTEIKSREKGDIIAELIDLFEGDDKTKDLKTIKEAVLEREKIMSTGVGKGFAIPHAKTDAVEGIIASFGRTSEPVDFKALDGKPVRLVFLLVGRNSMVGEHIKLLSRISRIMNSDKFRENLLTADSKEAIFRLFEEEENKFHH